MLGKLLILGLAGIALTVHHTGADVIKAYSDIDYQASGAQYLRWSVEVYRYTDGVPEHTCGGSLVKPAVVISAGRCFWGKEGQLPASRFLVTQTFVGKDREYLRNTFSKSAVRAIYVLPSFQDLKGLYADDIAVLKLMTPLRGVTPICVSFDEEMDRRQLVEGNCGRTMGVLDEAGYGLPPQLYTALEFPYVTKDRCANESKPYFREQLTHDKICAEFPPGPISRPEHQICRGEHGSGLAFYTGSSHAAIPYLRGVASIPSPDPSDPYWTLSRCMAFRAQLLNSSPDDAGRLPDSLQRQPEPRGVRYAAFTHVASHRAFLERHVPGLEATCAQHYRPAVAADVGDNFECNCHCNNKLN